MSTQIYYKLFPLGLIKPTAGAPVQLNQNIADVFESAPQVNLILFQAHWANQGRIYLGQANMNVATGEGINFVLLQPGDSFVLDTDGALNIFDLSSWRIDCSSTGDGVFVSISIR